MKNRFTVAVTTIILALCGGSAFAADAENGASLLRTLKVRTIILEKQLRELQKEIKTVKKDGGSGADSLAERFVHGPSVVTSPAMGVRRSADDASDMMVKLSSMNEDLSILRLREKMDNYALEHGLALMERPVISISGGLEAEASYKHREGYSKRRLADLDLSRAEFDVVGFASEWATGVINVAYEDSANNILSRIDNSRFKLDRGFITIGQLSKCPVYLTIGQVFAPFGSYSSYMVTSPSTKLLGRTKDRMAILGYVADNVLGKFSLQVYGFAGDTKRVGGNNFFDHGGANLDYTYTDGGLKMMVGGGVIGSLMESDGVFDAVVTDGKKEVHRRSHGLSARTKISYGMFNFRAEYVGAGKRFDSRDMTFNGNGTKPQALNFEGAVEFKTYNKPSTFALGYGRTWQALALTDVPKHNFFGAYSISLIKNTILGFEYRHDIDYGTKDISMTFPATPKVGTGKHRNVVTAQLGVYF